MPRSLCPSPQASRALARIREAAALRLLYEQGGATSAQLGRYMYGNAFKPQTHNHLTVIRRLRRRGLIAFITTTLGVRLYYLTPLGHAEMADLVEPDYRLPRTDFRSGRSSVTLAHDLGVLGLRLAVEECGLSFVSEKTLRTAWGSKAAPKVPDGLIGIPSAYPYWPHKVPIALEFEHSPRSITRRLLMLSAGEKIIGKRVAAVIVVARQSAVDGWRSAIDQARQRPVFEVMGAGGRRRVKLDVALLRFWSFCVPEALPGLLNEGDGLRLARRSEGVAEWPWDCYLPWLSLRESAADAPGLGMGWANTCN